MMSRDVVLNCRAEGVVDVPNGGPEEDKVSFVGIPDGNDVGDDFVRKRRARRARTLCLR